MTSSGPKSLPSIGFLTVCQHSDEGLFGGYLVLNSVGRPLEFHCTAPVRPNRAQEILYGPTLQPFLYGEHIGRALLSKSESAPLFVCTDVEPALAVRQFAACPVVLVEPSHAAADLDSDAADSRRFRVDPPHHRPAGPLLEFPLGTHRLAVCRGHEGDRERVIEHWSPHASEFDLAEPFERIREAIDEARQSAN